MDNLESYLRTHFDIKNIFEVIYFNHTYSKSLMGTVMQSYTWYSQGTYNKYDHPDIYCDLYNVGSDEYYEINLTQETHTKTDKWIKNVNWIKPVSEFMTEDICFLTIKEQFKQKLIEVLKHKNNSSRDITNIIVPTKKNVEKVTKIKTTNKNIYQYVGFYHGIANNGKYACVGFFINKFSFIKVLFRWEYSRVSLKSIAIPWYNSKGEEFSECKKKYTFRLTNLKASGYNLTLKTRNPFIQTMRPTKLDKQQIKYPCIVSEKMDGVRCQLIYENGIWVPYSRRGLYLHNVNSIANFIHSLPTSLRECVLNIEVVYKNGNLSQISGALNSDFPSQDHYNQVRYYLFDVTPCMKNKYPIFDDKLNIVEYVEEDKVYKRILNVLRINKYCIKKQINLLRSPKFLLTKNEKELNDFYNSVNEKGGEGIVIHNDLQDVYIAGRNKNILKKKRFEDIEVVLNNIISGTGAHKKRAIAVFVHKGKEYHSMIKGEQMEHDEYLNHKQKYVGKIITIRVVAADSTHEIRHPSVVSMNCGK